MRVGARVGVGVRVRVRIRVRVSVAMAHGVLVAVEDGGVHAAHQPRLVRAGELRVS